MRWTDRTMRRLTVGSLATVLLAALACAPAGSGGPHRAASEGTSGTSDAAAGDVRLAPEFELPDLSGKTVKLSDTAGRVRLIDFWATWCPPCRDEIPMLNELHRAYTDHGLTILAISDEKGEVVKDFADDVGMDYTNLLDSGEVTAQYRVLGLPTAYLLDGEGRIVETFFGPKPRTALEKQIRELLELPPAT